MTIYYKDVLTSSLRICGAFDQASFKEAKKEVLDWAKSTLDTEAECTVYELPFLDDPPKGAIPDEKLENATKKATFVVSRKK